MNWAVLATFLLALAVIFGAFGAHTLKDKISDYNLEIYNKGVFYQFIHSIGILFLGLFLIGRENKFLRLSALFLLLGIIFFSGSLYLLSLRDISFTGSITKILGPITPLGGLCFVAGWILMGLGLRQTTR